ncbi:MAG: hypothetical protein V3U29_08790, partial [Phycisphaeraceae bacterium]
MSSGPAPSAVGGVPESAARMPASRSFAARVLADTFSRFGARLGVVWIGALVLAGVFAPFLSNSHPIVMKAADGAWSSPLVRHLTPADVSLLVIFFAAVGLAAMRRARLGPRVLLLVILAVATIIVTTWPNLPDLLRYYRQSAIADALAPWCKAPRLYVLTGGWAVGSVALTLWVLSRMPEQSIAVKAVVLIGFVMVMGVLVVVPVRAPAAVVYSQYREAAAAGEVAFALYTPIAFSPTDYQRDQADARLKAPSMKHWLGTEVNGADLLSRMIHASRIALAIGLISTGIALFIGVVIGSVMGYFSGKADIIGMRLVEIVEAIPTLFLLIIFVSFFGRNLYFMMVIIGLTSWTGYCRFIRA